MRGKRGKKVEIEEIDEEEMRRIRGKDIGMVLKEKMKRINKVYKIGEKIGEKLRVKRGKRRREEIEEEVEIIERVGIKDERRSEGKYKNEL